VFPDGSQLPSSNQTWIAGKFPFLRIDEIIFPAINVHLVRGCRSPLSSAQTLVGWLFYGIIYIADIYIYYPMYWGLTLYVSHNKVYIYNLNCMCILSHTTPLDIYPKEKMYILSNTILLSQSIVGTWMWGNDGFLFGQQFCSSEEQLEMAVAVWWQPQIAPPCVYIYMYLNIVINCI
jgi:hypothetical protein